MPGADLHTWVVVSTAPGEYFGKSNKAVDTYRLLTESSSDLEEVADKRLSRGERIGVLGANQSHWYVTFNNPASSDSDQVDGAGEPTQKIGVYNSFEELQSDWRIETGYMTITQLASRGDKIVALFEPMFPEEHCNLFWHEGSLSAATLHQPVSRRSMGFVTGTYFLPEDKWIFVFSDNAPITEKWSVGPAFDQAFVKRGIDDGYKLRQTIATPYQWFVIMQKSARLDSAKQTFYCSNTNPKDFEIKSWKENHIITCATGNAPLNRVLVAA